MAKIRMYSIIRENVSTGMILFGKLSTNLIETKKVFKQKNNSKFRYSIYVIELPIGRDETIYNEPNTYNLNATN